MEEINDITQIENAVRDSRMLLVSLSKPGCAACKTLRPAVEKMLTSFPQVRSVFVDLEKTGEARDRFAVEEIPTILLYTRGKESYRVSRSVSQDVLLAKLTDYYGILFG